MQIAAFANRVQKLAADNSPTLLTAVSVVGTVTTAVLSGRASVRAYQILEEERLEVLRHEVYPEPLTKKEKGQLVWREFVPPVAVGTLTIASIICANQIGTRRAAAMAAAYSLSEKLHREYKDKVIETIGETKERAMRDQLAQDRIDRNPPSSEVTIVGTGAVLCYDQYTGRYFNSTVEDIKGAQNAVNYRILQDGYQSLSDFYERLGLPATSVSEEVGWTNSSQLEILFSTCISPDGRPAISIDFDTVPTRNYHKHHYGS